MSWITVIVVLLTIAIILGAIILILAIQRAQVRMQRRTYAVEISNQGNARSRYELWAEDQNKLLKYEFLLPSAAVKTPAASPSQPVGQNLLDVPSSGPVHPGKPAMPQTKEAGGAVGGFANVIADISDTLGHLVPGSIGYKILSVSERIRQGQSAVKRTQRVEQRVTGYAPQGKAISPQAAGSAYQPSPVATTNVTAMPSAAAQSGLIVLEHPQTAYVDPGKQLKISLHIRPAARLNTDTVAFTLLSKSLDDPAAQPLSDTLTLSFPGSSGFRFYLPSIAVGAIAVILVLVVLLLLLTHVIG